MRKLFVFLIQMIWNNLKLASSLVCKKILKIGQNEKFPSLQFHLILCCIITLKNSFQLFDVLLLWIFGVNCDQVKEYISFTEFQVRKTWFCIIFYFRSVLNPPINRFLCFSLFSPSFSVSSAWSWLATWSSFWPHAQWRPFRGSSRGEATDRERRWAPVLRADTSE